MGRASAGRARGTDGAPGRELLALAGLRVADPETLRDVPADGTTMGEICLRGNTVMKGYLKNPTATARPSPAAGSTPATWRCCIPTAMSR